MLFLIDQSPRVIYKRIKQHHLLIRGQLLTPLTRYKNAGMSYAIDNGAFSRFDAAKFAALLVREEPRMDECLFVTIPDIVGNARRTLEIWKERDRFARHWRKALVAQDGIEDLDIPWNELDAIFIGGWDGWKDSRAVIDIVKTAKTLGVHVHVGRVNTHRRYMRFYEAGADTCDGTGVSMYDHMLDDIMARLTRKGPALLFQDEPADDADAMTVAVRESP